MIGTSSSTFDTNILIYSIDPSEERKHRIASRIVDAIATVNGKVPLQTLNEFYRATTKKRILAPERATLVVQNVAESAQLVPPDETDLYLAMQIHQTTSIQFFDALLLATAARSGCTTFFSEDLQHNRAYGSVTVRNPFLLSSAELDALLQ